METSAIQHFCSVLISMSVLCYLVRLFSAIQHFCSMGSVYDHFLFCTILYLWVPIVPRPSYSLLLVYASKHLYDVYLNNEQYEHERNQLR